MHTLRTIITASLVLMLSLSVGGLEISIGDRKMDVPLPSEFVELAPTMSPHYKTMNAYIAKENTRYFTLITEGDAAAILRGENVELVRYMHVESPMGTDALSVTSSYFTELRQIIRDQSAELYANLASDLPSLVEEGNKAVSADYAAEIAVEVGGIVPLPVHFETSTAIAKSMYMTIGVTVDNENLTNGVLAATTLVLHVRDKIIFLYIYADKADLDWTRSTAETWASHIVEANPLTANEERAISETETLGFNWKQLLEKTLIGAVIGGGATLVMIFLRRRKQSGRDTR